ncbi:MAG TPA: PspC domain-containing protein [Gemmatales bacterium]|nr:PspC domain-containing protein [Gemmatales bacterium]
MSIADEIGKLDALRQNGAISQLEFEKAKHSLLDPLHSHSESQVTARSTLTLRKSRDDAMVSGVCGGLGAYSGIPSLVWRLGMLAMFFGVGYGMKTLGVRDDLVLVLSGPAIYFLFSVCMPRAVITKEQSLIARKKLTYSGIGAIIGIITVIVVIQGKWLNIRDDNLQYLLFVVLGGVIGLLLGSIIHSIISPNS